MARNHVDGRHLCPSLRISQSDDEVVQIICETWFQLIAPPT